MAAKSILLLSLEKYKGLEKTKYCGESTKMYAVISFLSVVL
jgi:hypothetical protein